MVDTREGDCLWCAVRAAPISSACSDGGPPPLWPLGLLSCVTAGDSESSGLKPPPSPLTATLPPLCTCFTPGLHVRISENLLFGPPQTKMIAVCTSSTPRGSGRVFPAQPE